MFTMSEQENSRSPQSGIVLAGASAEAPQQDHEPPGASSCTNGNSSATPDSGMGNNVFSSLEKPGDKSEGSMGEGGDGGESGIEVKVDCEEQGESGVCAETQSDLLCPLKVMRPDMKEDKVPSDSVSPSAEVSDMGASEGKAGRDESEMEASVVSSNAQDDERLNGDSQGCCDASDGCTETPARAEEEKQGCEGEEKNEIPEIEENTLEPSNTETERRRLRRT